MAINESALTQSSNLQFLSIKINDTKLTDEDIVTAELTWNSDVLEVNGSLIIKDNLDLMNLLQLSGKTYVTIYGVDLFDDFWERKFIITDIVESRIKEKFKTYNFILQDEISFELMNTYVSKSYAGKKLSEIFQDYWNNFKYTESFITPFVNTKLKVTFNDTEKIHEFITVPQDRSFYDFMTQELYKEGYTLFQYRNEIVLQKKAELVPSLLETLEYDLTQIHPRAEYMFRIHDLNINLNSIKKENELAPVSKLHYFNFDTKEILDHNIILKDIYSYSKLNNFDNIGNQITTGTKYYTQQESTDKRMISDVSNAYSDNSILDVVVSGNFKYNKFYQNYNVVLIGNLEHKVGQLEGDVVMNGLYTCNKVIDRYMSQKMIQKLSLSRIDFTKKK
jgi:hypothetical protein